MDNLKKYLTCLGVFVGLNFILGFVFSALAISFGGNGDAVIVFSIIQLATCGYLSYVIVLKEHVKKKRIPVQATMKKNHDKWQGQ